jgi:hypothetical protein
MLRSTARELLRREEWVGRLTSSHISRSLGSLPLAQLAAFSTSRTATAEPARVEDTPIPPVSNTPASVPAGLDFNSPWEAYRVRI